MTNFALTNGQQPRHHYLRRCGWNPYIEKPAPEDPTAIFGHVTEAFPLVDSQKIRLYKFSIQFTRPQLQHLPKFP